MAYMGSLRCLTKLSEAFAFAFASEMCVVVCMVLDYYSVCSCVFGPRVVQLSFSGLRFCALPTRVVSNTQGFEGEAESGVHVISYHTMSVAEQAGKHWMLDVWLHALTRF